MKRRGFFAFLGAAVAAPLIPGGIQKFHDGGVVDIKNGPARLIAPDGSTIHTFRSSGVLTIGEGGASGGGGGGRGSGVVIIRVQGGGASGGSRLV